MSSGLVIRVEQSMINKESDSGVKPPEYAWHVCLFGLDSLNPASSL